VATEQVQPTEGDRPDELQSTVKVDDMPAVYEGRIFRDMLVVLNMARTYVTRMPRC
jgi:hypothetical protein